MVPPYRAIAPAEHPPLGHPRDIGWRVKRTGALSLGDWKAWLGLGFGAFPITRATTPGRKFPVVSGTSCEHLWAVTREESDPGRHPPAVVRGRYSRI